MLNLKFSHLSEPTPGIVTLEFVSGEIISVELYGRDTPNAGMVITQAIPISISGVNGDRCELEALPIFTASLHAVIKPSANMVVDCGLGAVLSGHDSPRSSMSIVLVIPVALNGADATHGKILVRGISKRRVDDGIRRGPCNLQFSSGNLFSNSNALEFDPKYRKPPPIANRASVSISAYVP